jgi:hypothetical protein
MHGRTHGSGLVSLSRHRKEWMGRPQGRPYAAKERLRRWVMEKIGAPGFAAARYLRPSRDIPAHSPTRAGTGSVEPFVAFGGLGRER